MSSSDNNTDILLIVLAAIVSFLIVGVSAFLLIGILWGVFVSVRNYIVAVSKAGRYLGQTVSLAWSSNVQSSEWFFDCAKSYTKDKKGLLKALVSSFFTMSGVGVVVFGSLFMPFWIVVHFVFWLLLLPVRLLRDGKGVERERRPGRDTVSGDGRDSDGYLRVPRLPDGSIVRSGAPRGAPGRNRDDGLVLSDAEQKYMGLYAEYARDGGVSDRERRLLDITREQMGVSEERGRAIEELVGLVRLSSWRDA